MWVRKTMGHSFGKEEHHDRVLERKMVSHNTQGNMASDGIHQRIKAHRRDKQRRGKHAVSRNIPIPLHHPPQGAHRVRRNTDYRATTVPSIRKQRLRIIL